MSGSYREAYAASAQDPNAFWLEAADAIDWITKPTKALDDRTAPVYRWFPDAELNTCYNAIDRHVLAGRGDQTEHTPGLDVAVRVVGGCGERGDVQDLGTRIADAVRGPEPG